MQLLSEGGIGSAEREKGEREERQDYLSHTRTNNKKFIETTNL